MDWSPMSVTFGVRHQNLFGFLGRAGDILDSVNSLQESSRSLPRRVFTTVRWPNPITAEMLNENETISVQFSIEGVILTVDLEETDLTRERVKQMFVELTRTAFAVTEVERVNRIGIIDNYTIERPRPGEAAANTLTTLANIGEPGDFNLRASFRSPTTAGLVKGNVNDWRNTILQVVAKKKGKKSEVLDSLQISIDHQIYFVPEHTFSETLIDEHYRRFLDEIAKLQRGQLTGLAIEESAAR